MADLISSFYKTAQDDSGLLLSKRLAPDDSLLFFPSHVDELGEEYRIPGEHLHTATRDQSDANGP